MQFSTLELTPPLDAHLESVFHYSGFNPEHQTECVVPTAHVFVLFALDGLPRHTHDSATRAIKATFKDVWISGMQRRHLIISALPDSEMLVMQFKTHGAHPFLHVPVAQLNEQVVPAEAVLGEGVLTLHKRLCAAQTPQQKLQLAGDWMRRRFDAERCPPQALLDVLTALREAPAARHAEIVAEYPHSQKHLIAQFHRYFGLTPKYLQRIFRFNELLARIHNKETIAWADIAHHSGFSDQSHFIREFRHFCGFNPQQFIDRSHHQQPPNFFPLD